MRQLAEEGRKAREAAAGAPAAPCPLPPITIGIDVGEPVPDGEAYPWPYVWEPRPAGQLELCIHGRALRDPCHECGRS